VSRQAGFRVLKPGRIHMRCPECGRKQSNMTRADYDHPTAFMMELLCDRCDAGCFPTPTYFDSRGRELSNFYATALVWR
jgi:hypothetical protein